MKLRIHILFLFSLFANVSFAEEPKLVATASSVQVAVGANFQVSYSLNTNGTAFRGPSFADFTVRMGPSTSTSVQIMNGNFSQQVTFSYIIYGNKEGTFTIGPASVNVGGKIIQSNSLKIVVVKGGTALPGNDKTADGEKMFMRTVVSRSKCSQGDYIIVSHKIYSRDRIVGYNNPDFPTYDGFWSQVLGDPRQAIVPTTENLDGVVYNVATLRQAVLFPQRSGTLEIKPMNVEIIVRQKGKSSGDDFWDNMFGPTYKDVAFKLKGTSSKVEVMPLPSSGRPEDFGGAVGTFSIAAKTDKTKTKANEAINLTLTISGKGNLKLLESPKVTIPDNIESFDPKSTENISISSNGMSGSRTFEYVLIPRHSGQYKITVDPFSYFDPEKNSYVTLSSPEFDLSIEKNGKEEENVVISPNDKQEVKQISSDVRYIKTELKTVKQKGDEFFSSGRFWTLLCSPGILFCLFLAYRKKQEKENADPVSFKSKKAARLAQKRLSVANKHLLAGNKDLFYEEVLRTVNAYVSDRLNLPVSDLSKDTITSAFAAKNIAADVTEKFLSIIQTCEFARYAPAGSAVEMGNMYNDALETIIKIEETIS